MSASTKGLVIREQTIGESDRLVTLLTADLGLVRAFVRGSKQTRSRLASTTSLFAYSDFSLIRAEMPLLLKAQHPLRCFLS